MAKNPAKSITIESDEIAKKQRIAELEKLIHKHNIKYFLENDPEISDEEFDKLTRELEKLNPNSPVLYELVGEIGTIEHPVPMLSLDKKFTHDTVIKWINDVNDTHYIVEPKYDGMAARYQSGKLATRGDGHFGEDISERLPQLKIIGELPKDNSSAYGEIVIPLAYFNEHLATTYKNPRNAVVGIVKAKIIKPAGVKALLDGGVHLVMHDQAKHLIVTAEDLKNEERWEEILEEMFRSEYPLDGIVIKAKDQRIRVKLGATSHHQKWEVAYKTPAERKWSKVTEIKDQVGRTGRVTSVAVIEPVELSGATVTNVTLHNHEFVKKSKIGVGSKVEVCRSGEVIPFITQVIPAKNPHIPRATCPVCNKPLKEYGKYLECVNPSCPARLSQSIEYFFKVLGAEELGLKTIERFINEFKLKSIADFYSLDPEEIADLDGFGPKSAQKIIQNIKATLDETVSPENLLQALGIKEIGPATSRWIISQHGFDNLPKLKVEDLENVKGIGPVKARHFIEEIKAKWPTVEKLQQMGLKFKKEKRSNKLEGKSFAITGKKGRYSRDELVEIINKNGGEYKTSITKDTDYLIAGDDAGSKLDKANQLGAKIINETDFLRMVGN